MEANCCARDKGRRDTDVLLSETADATVVAAVAEEEEEEEEGDVEPPFDGDLGEDN
jgi:hypothetical protein